MCHNAETSLATFVVGSLLCYALRKYKLAPVYRAVSFIWQYALIMQLLEFIAWKTHKECGAVNQMMKKLAAFFNMTQPIAAYLVLLFTFPEVSTARKLLASIPCILYAAAAARMVSTGFNSKSKCMSPSDDGCTHLQYDWWKGKNSGATVTLYMLSLLSSVLLLVPAHSRRVGILNLAIITVTLFVSMKFYSCGTPSMWCWMVSAAPALNLVGELAADAASLPHTPSAPRSVGAGAHPLRYAFYS